MKSRERVLAALSRREPDRVPYCELAIDRAFVQKLGEWREIPAGDAAFVQKNPFSVEEAKQICSLLGMDNILYVLRQPIYAHMHVGKDGRTFPGDGMIKAEADLPRIQLPEPSDDALYAEAAEFAEKKGDYAAFFVTRMGLAPAMLSLGIETFALSLYDNRKLVERVLDVYFDWMAVVAERVMQLGFDVFCTADDFAFKAGLMFSPHDFEEIVVPRYHRVLEKVTIPWLVHSDGNIGEAVDILIGLGAAGIHPVEKGAMDIRAIKATYGGRLSLAGNVDMNILGMGTPEDTDREVFELIRDIGPGGGYIVTSGNSLASYLKVECVKAMAEAVRKYGHYPIELA